MCYSACALISKAAFHDLFYGFLIKSRGYITQPWPIRISVQLEESPYRENQMFTCHSRKQAAAPDAIFTFLLKIKFASSFSGLIVHFITLKLRSSEIFLHFLHFGTFIQVFRLEFGSFTHWKSGNAVLFSTPKNSFQKFLEHL